MTDNTSERGNRRWFLWSAILLQGLPALTGCGGRLCRAPVDLAPARFAASAPGSEDWTRAPAVSVGRDGKVAFLWNDDGLYCRVHDPRGWPDSDEVLCVSVTGWGGDGKARRVHLFFFDGLTPTGPGSFKATSGGWGWADGIRRAELDPKACRVKIEPRMPTKRGFGAYRAETFISWVPLTGAESPPRSLIVHVYEIKSARPYAFLKMDASK